MAPHRRPRAPPSNQVRRALLSRTLRAPPPPVPAPGLPNSGTVSPRSAVIRRSALEIPSSRLSRLFERAVLDTRKRGGTDSTSCGMSSDTQSLWWGARTSPTRRQRQRRQRTVKASGKRCPAMRPRPMRPALRARNPPLGLDVETDTLASCGPSASSREEKRTRTMTSIWAR